MSYNTIKDELNLARKKFLKLKKVTQSFENDLLLIKQERTTIERKYRDEIDLSKKKALDILKNTTIEPFSIQLNQIESKKIALKAEHDIIISNITEEVYYDKFKSETDIQEEVKSSIVMLRDKIKLVTGERFQNELILQIDAASSHINVDNLDIFVKKFNALGLTIGKMSHKKKFDFYEAFNAIIAKVQPEKYKENTNVFVIYVISCILFSTLIIYFAFPFILAFLVLLCIINVLNNYKIYKAMLELKSVENNINSIETLIKEGLKTEVERDRATAIEVYEDAITALISESESITNLASEMLDEKINSFYFDESSYLNNMDLTLKSLDNREISLSGSLSSERKEIEESLLEVRRLEKALEESAGLIVKEYLDYGKIGTSNMLDPLFLLDIVDSKPILFKHPEGSCVFIYDDRSSVIDFIKLLLCQLLIRLNAYNLSVQVWDKRFLGAEFGAFKMQHESMTYEELFKVCFNDEAIMDSTDLLADNIARRTINIKGEFVDINSYNKHMLSTESLTESYIFLFLQDIPYNTLLSDKMTQVLLNGGDIGIFANIFINSEEFFAGKEQSINLLKSIGNVYVIENGEIMARAKDFILEELSKEE